MEQSLPHNVDRLIEQLKNPDSSQRISAAAGLARLDCHDERVIRALVKVYRDDPDRLVRGEAQYSISRLLGFPVRPPDGWTPAELEEKILTEAHMAAPTPETPTSRLAEDNRFLSGKAEADNGQSEQVLVIESEIDDLKNIMWGVLSIIFGSIFFFITFAQKSEMGAVFYLFAFAALWLVSVGVYFLIALPTIYTFDRGMGKLIVQHCTQLFKWKSSYPLSEIIAVRVITTIVKDKGKSSYSLSLGIGNVLVIRSMTISTSESMFIIEADAKRIASFLGLSVEREIKETYSPPDYP